jgi:hypothetical protein
MAYLGIGYIGDQSDFFQNLVEQYRTWLKGDRMPRFYGDRFIVLYDSNTAREFAKKCCLAAAESTITIYPMEKPLDNTYPPGNQ